jgi:hypothetical protein
MTIKGKVSRDGYFFQKSCFLLSPDDPTPLLFNIGNASTCHTERRRSELEKGGSHYGCDCQRGGGLSGGGGGANLNSSKKIHGLLSPFFPVGTP